MSREQVMLTVVGTGVTTGPLPVLLPQVDVELTATLSDADLSCCRWQHRTTLEPDVAVVQGQHRDQRRY